MHDDHHYCNDNDDDDDDCDLAVKKCWGSRGGTGALGKALGLGLLVALAQAHL